MIGGIGETWLLTCSSDDRLREDKRGTVYRLRALETPPAAVPDIDLVKHARAGLARIAKQARRELPFAIDPARLLAREPSWVAEYHSGVDARTIDGTSVGVPAYLCAASLLLGIPVPSSVAGTGIVEPDGRITPVAGIRAKTLAIGRSHAELRKVIVPAATADTDNPSEARRALQALDLDMEVAGVSHVSQLLTVALGEPKVQDTLKEHLADPVRRARIVQSLFRMTVRGESRVLGWAPIAKLARNAIGLCSDPEEKARAEAACAIAERHTDVSARPLGVISGVPESIQLELLAHDVQAVADNPGLADDPALARSEALQVIREAQGRIADRQPRPAELRLMGAIGRARAAWGELEQAHRVLVEACEGWEAILRPEESSYALCERLRVASLLGDPAALDPALDFAEQYLGLFQEVSQSYVRVAAARALVDACRPEDAERWLGPVEDWSFAPKSVEELQARVRGRALLLRGDHQRSATTPTTCSSLEAALERVADERGSDLTDRDLDDAIAAHDADSRLKSRFRHELERIRENARQRGQDVRWVVRALRY